MFALIRTLVYATIFIGVVLVWLPASIISSAGITRPPATGAPQIIGMIMGALGLALALSCALTFAIVGKGTPAPFDPPRRLVVSGPYRVVRNPMYLGAALALAGVALFYGSVGVWGFTVVFLLVVHLFILFYEEPTLRRTFGSEYDAYTRRVRRYWPIPRR